MFAAHPDLHAEILSRQSAGSGASVSKQTISTITDRVLEGMGEWQSRRWTWGGTSSVPSQSANPPWAHISTRAARGDRRRH